MRWFYNTTPFANAYTRKIWVNILMKSLSLYFAICLTLVPPMDWEKDENPCLNLWCGSGLWYLDIFSFYGDVRVNLKRICIRSARAYSHLCAQQIVANYGRNSWALMCTSWVGACIGSYCAISYSRIVQTHCQVYVILILRHFTYTKLNCNTLPSLLEL